MSRAGGIITAGTTSPMPDPQLRVFDAIERGRVAVGIMTPLASRQRARIRLLLAQLGIGGGTDSS